MISGLANLAMPFLRTLEPEQAHEVTLLAMETGLFPKSCGGDDKKLAQTIWGLDFPNPLGIAAGFDKDARVPDAILDAGFGFSEIGTVTPQPQPGNPRPRIFRLPGDGAMINRLGFNSAGHAKALARLEKRAKRGVIGVNIGANKDSTNRDNDYVSGLETFSGVADYFTVNISSPNTPGLRDLQAPKELDRLLARLMIRRDELAEKGQVAKPLAVKLSPDIADEDVAPICERLMAHGVDGILVSNTTLSREGLSDQKKAEAGGMSGAPLYERSTRLLARVYVLTQGRIPLIGIGGIHSGETALGKIEAGASLIQLYTGLVYGGPVLVDQIKSTLSAAVARSGVASIGDLTGTKAKSWT